MSRSNKKPREKTDNKPTEPAPAAPDNSQLDLPGGNSEFKNIVEESKAQIQSEGVKEVKRGKRGRPKGSTSKAERSRPSLDQAPAQPGAPVGTPPPDISKHLAVGLKAISKIPAQNTKIPELAFSDDEAMLCAQSLNAILEAFVPDIEKMSPKTAAILGAFATFGSVGFSKTVIYQNEMRKRKANFEAGKEPVRENQSPVKVEKGPDSQMPPKPPKGNPLDYVGLRHP